MSLPHVKHLVSVCLFLACAPAVVPAAGHAPGNGLSAAPGNDGKGNVSGLDLSIDTPLLSVDLDYDLRTEETGAGDALAQRITGTLHSDTLASLGVDASFSSSARVEADGDRFRHRLDSVLQRPVAGLAVLRARYRIELDKAGADLSPVHRQSVLLRADGEGDAGRLQWGGSFREVHSVTAAAAGDSERNVIELRSSYRVVPELLLDLRSRSLTEWQREPSRAPARDERRYGAGIHWEPAKDYRLELSVDRLEERALGVEELVASGSLHWVPSPAWSLVLRYTERLQQSGPGFLLEANINLGGG